MGEVLLATDTRLKRKVAIKRVLGTMAKSKTAVRRFTTEAQSIAALNHSNIVQIYDYGRAADGRGSGGVTIAKVASRDRFQAQPIWEIPVVRI